jgi:hypothetical protein
MLIILFLGSPPFPSFSASLRKSGEGEITAFKLVFSWFLYFLNWE